MGILVIVILLSGLITFVGLFFIFRQFNPKKSPRSNPIYWASSFFGTPILLAFVIWIWFLVSSNYQEKEFDSMAWKDKRETRYEYVDDLINNNKAIGLEKSELIERLGQPDNQSDTSLTYYIGYTPKYFMNMDPDWLEIRLQDNVASEVWVAL